MLEATIKSLEVDRKAASNLAMDEVFLEIGDGSGIEDGSDNEKVGRPGNNGQSLKAGKDKSADAAEAFQQA